jgi:deoxyinosine 3'endonuclease (endonuclease V)
MVQLKLPYIPGFLAFREVEFLVELLDELKSLQPELMPQLIFVDGNGYLHPRGLFGLCVCSGTSSFDWA